MGVFFPGWEVGGGGGEPGTQSKQAGAISQCRFRLLRGDIPLRTRAISHKNSFLHCHLLPPRLLPTGSFAPSNRARVPSRSPPQGRKRVENWRKRFVRSTRTTERVPYGRYSAVPLHYTTTLDSYHYSLRRPHPHLPSSPPPLKGARSCHSSAIIGAFKRGAGSPVAKTRVAQPRLESKPKAPRTAA